MTKVEREINKLDSWETTTQDIWQEENNEGYSYFILLKELYTASVIAFKKCKNFDQYESRIAAIVDNSAGRGKYNWRYNEFYKEMWQKVESNRAFKKKLKNLI